MRWSRHMVGAAVLLAASSARAQRPLPTWTRGATCYEVFVPSFQDRDGDGIGDLEGLIRKLDYIDDGNPRSHRDLGARCIWLMPVAESPSYHGYDVTDYYRVARDYGTNEDFRRLMAAAHKRGIRVLVDMVLNHSSSEHPYFRAALRDTASPYRAWYRWSPTKPAELNPWGQSNWHKSPVRDEWYYGFFWSGMPDLNYLHPPVLAEAKAIARFWLEDMGADGFRLDAVPYLVEEPGHIVHSEGTHAVLAEYGKYVRNIAPASYTVGEVTYDTRTMRTYYPDQLDSYFAFELADSIISGVRRGTGKGIVPAALLLQDSIPDARWSPFLRNHDQPRTRTELGGDMRKAAVAATIMLTMPGVPFVYYGEEIGMTGSKPDEQLRTPMQWSAEPGAGFTAGRPWERLQSDSSSITVESQDHDPASLLNLHRALIHLRAQHSALAAGRIVPVSASSDAAVAYVRRDGRRAALVVANLGDAPLAGLSLTSAAGALAPGRWHLESLLDSTRAASIHASSDGRIDAFVPLAVLAPTHAYVFDLTAAH